MKNKKYKRKIFTTTLVLIMILSITTPMGTVFASDLQNTNEQGTSPVIKLTGTELIINGEKYTPTELTALLDTGEYISNDNTSVRQNRSAAVAAVGASYFIPGVGEVVMTATGVIIVAGVVIGTGHWAYKTIKNYFASKKKNNDEQRQGPLGKPNRKKQGREIQEKKRTEGNKKWNPNPNKDPNKPMKKHTPGKKHKGGK